jgi:hypothetical protein
VTGHTSLYADDNLLDFYISSFDKINNAFPIYKKLLLYNGYTINPVTLSNLRFGISNFWNSAAASNKGDYFPTIIRLSGTVTTPELNGANNKIAIFFTNLVPFYS